MSLQDAIEQYVDMIKLGSLALDRIAEHQLYGRPKGELRELVHDIVAWAEKLHVVGKP